MPNVKNQAEVKALSEKFDEAKSVVVANYSGLDVKAQTELRAKIAEAGGEFKVSKNRLFKIVAEEKLGGEDPTLTEALNGQNAFLFAIEDAVSALKALFEFADENEALEIKMGILDGKILSYKETEGLSKLPSKEELIAKLISQINGPMYGLVNVVQGPTRNLVYVLNAIKDKKSE